MFTLSLNYICRVYNPLHEQGNENKFRFDLCFRKDLIMTDGKLYDSIIDCTKALCEYIVKISEYEDKQQFNPIIVNDFKYYNYEKK